MEKSKKIITKEDFSKLRTDFRNKGLKVVLCHGVFDLLHYGHIEHLKEAKAQGDILVVSVTAARFVNKGPGRPYFNDEQRMSFLASIECVDYVILSEAVTVHKIVECVQPDIYVKGQEYASEKNDITGNIGSEQEIVEKLGGQIYFTDGEVHSSTRLLNNFFGALSEDVLKASQKLHQEYGDNLLERICEKVDEFSKLNVLVVGDIIFDEYNFCSVQGVTMKDATMSTLYENTEVYLGGSMAIARHIANFAGGVTLLSMMGPEKKYTNTFTEGMGSINCTIVKDDHFVTPVKIRYLKHNPIRQEYDKLFSINHLATSEKLDLVNYNDFYKTLEEMCKTNDVVVVCDYGHGLLDDTSIKIIEDNANYLAVNCQTNSSNYGMNLITKYNRMDAFVVDERELKLSFGQTRKVREELLTELKERFSANYAWLTLGAKGALGIKENEVTLQPAVTLHIKDTVGAGDAFYSLAALASATNMPLPWATLVSNIAGAIKTNTVGNSQPIKKVDLLKFVATVLNV